MLVSYSAFTVASPYAGEGPVFAHADGCTAHQPLPDALLGRVGTGVCGDGAAL
jgi:hypothetical protein